MAESVKEPQHLSRREFLRRAATVTAGVSAVSVLGGLEGTQAVHAAAPRAEAKKVQLYALAWQPDAVAALQKAVDDWNKANSDIVAEYVQGDWGKVQDFITTSLAGGVAPELIQGITSWAIQYGTQGAYEDLSSFIAGSDLKDDLHPAALAAATSPLDNKVYSLPWCWEVGVLYVNADRFAEHNISLPEKGWTWDEFYGEAKKLTKPPDYYGLFANLSVTQTTEDLMAWMWQTGALVMGVKDGKWVIDLEPAREALSLWYDMIWKDKIVSENSFGADVANSVEAFSLGNFSMLQTGCWARRIITEGKPKFKWRMLPLPYKTIHAHSNEPQVWGVPSQTKDRGSFDAALKVLQFVSNKDNQTAIASGDWLFPTRKSALADPRFNTSDNDWNVAQGEVQYGKAYPKHPAWTEFDDRVLGPNIQLYLQKQMSLDDLISQSTAEGTKLIAKYQK